MYHPIHKRVTLLTLLLCKVRPIDEHHITADDYVY